MKCLRIHLLNNLTVPKYDKREDYKKKFSEDVTERLEKLEIDF